ncbi:MAG: MBL fold metallo-hydrolase [Desulfobacterales bacterium]|nr:MBL fold metallo-hydrolase [Desulfobacterales bacterium]
MQFCVLGSGSKGNATYVASGTTSLLIDGGFSGLEIRKRLAVIGIDISSLTAILVTHEHSDHIRGVGVLSRQGRLPVYANPATHTAAGPTLKKLFARREFETGTSFVINDFEIHPFSVSHDTADPVGFVLRNGRASLGLCTDTGMVSRLMHHRLAHCNGLVLESNHDPVLLKNGTYPPYLKQRIRGNKGHLANRDSARFLLALWHQGLEHVVLAHLSDANNRPELAYQEALLVLTTLAENGERQPVLSLGRQDRVGELVTLAGA